MPKDFTSVYCPKFNVQVTSIGAMGKPVTAWSRIWPMTFAEAEQIAAEESKKEWIIKADVKRVDDE